jgi:hypothetical protein
MAYRVLVTLTPGGRMKVGALNVGNEKPRPAHTRWAGSLYRRGIREAPPEPEPAYMAPEPGATVDKFGCPIVERQAPLATESVYAPPTPPGWGPPTPDMPNEVWLRTREYWRRLGRRWPA